MLRSFLLRTTLILSTTAAVCLLLMAATLFLQQAEGVAICLILFGTLLVWLVINFVAVRKIDPELTVEVARMVLPAGALLSLVLSMLLSTVLADMIPGTEGYQHLILIFVGLGVAGFLAVRCLDIKWLRPEDEIRRLEERRR